MLAEDLGVQVVAPMTYNTSSSDKDDEAILAGVSNNDEVSNLLRPKSDIFQFL
jgi:hypothetical protein